MLERQKLKMSEPRKAKVSEYVNLGTAECQNMATSETRNVGTWNSQIISHQNLKTSEFQNVIRLEYQKHGMSEPWKTRRVEHQNVKNSECRTLGTPEEWNIRTWEIRNVGTLEHKNGGTWEHRKLRMLKHWNVRNLECRNRGTPEPHSIRTWISSADWLSRQKNISFVSLVLFVERRLIRLMVLIQEQVGGPFELTSCPPWDARRYRFWPLQPPPLLSSVFWPTTDIFSLRGFPSNVLQNCLGSTGQLGQGRNGMEGRS